MSNSGKRDCNCGEGRGPVDPTSFRILDIDEKSLPEPGVEAKPRGYGCSGCKDGSGIIYRGAVAYHSGTRTCSMMVPVKISPDGVITWKHRMGGAVPGEPGERPLGLRTLRLP